MKHAVVLLSGGLDSTTLLFFAKARGFKAHCLIFDYQQRHKKEIRRAVSIARQVQSPFAVVKIALPWRGSALLDKQIPLPKNRSLKRISAHKIPTTYVPARNIIFLSFAVSYAEAIGAGTVFIGANAIDYSGYPDCRPEFYLTYREVLKTGLKSGVEGKAIKIATPLIHKTKAQIIQLGLSLKVPYHLTWSCYQGGKKPCGRCDSCLLREKGFAEIGKKDPSL